MVSPLRPPISLRTLALIAFPVALAGCAIGARNFDCPGFPEGAVCKSPQEVYKLTNHADRVTVDADGNVNTAASATAAAAATAYVPKRLVEPITQPMPVLQPAVTMRAWIAPWIDKNGDLHFPSLLFTEVTPRRWSVGEVAGRDARVLVPVAVESGGRSILDRADDNEPRGSGALPAVPSLPSPLPPK